MDYNYENIGPDRFQRLCQSLLLKEFPGTQCFPLNQRDGGRDAIQVISATGGSKSFNVFQVKHIENPSQIRNVHLWLRDTLQQEAPKVASLIPKGAKAYYLLTNVRGTAVPESGSIDRVDDLFRHWITIPSSCWWRDDLNRRLDVAFDLKWHYIDLFSGADAFRLILETGIAADIDRRTSTLIAFVRSQFEADKEVRFKQVELQNRLLDLYVDVPLGVPQHVEDPAVWAIWRLMSGGRSEFNRPEQVGAARFLLHESVSSWLPPIVLEGAPGQGKSTVTQYISQVHRMRILDEPDFSLVPNEHRVAAARVPVRLELRDYATWLDRMDPFTPEEHAAPADWNKSLESFIAAAIRHQSGGAAFSVSDLQAVLKATALLLVLDGLDEVADIRKRESVVA